MSGGRPSHVVRHDDLVWRLGPGRVLVRRVIPIVGAEDAADLVGSAAMAWIAADSPIDIDQIAHDTELSVDVATEAVAVLIDRRWLEEVDT